ncbi:MAG TPA: TIGR03435 family protein [Candidatus Limnocylindrales bacterium]|nr:TIGR03435 family protein [Candidatus Limnocylindrales bacterium]
MRMRLNPAKKQFDIFSQVPSPAPSSGGGPFVVMRLCGLATLLVAAAVAQPPSFDVASVKPNSSGSRITIGGGLRNSGYSVENITLRSLFAAAFGMPVSRIIGPDWMDTARFDIQAKAPAGTPDRQLALMLQTLLAVRFHSVNHREARDLPAYDMLVAKGGLKAQLHDPAHPPARTGRVSFSAQGATMANLADQLARVIGQPVIDRTGAEGRYDYAVSYAPLSTSADDGRPDIFAAVEQQLGVKLVPRKQPLEVLVIDHVERPTEN